MDNREKLRIALVLLMDIVKKGSSNDYSLYVTRALADDNKDNKIKNNIMIRFSLHPDISEIYIKEEANSIKPENIDKFIVSLFNGFVEKFDNKIEIKKDLTEQINQKMQSHAKDILSKIKFD